MGRYQVLSSAPPADGCPLSAHTDYPRIHESFDSKDQAGDFVRVLRTYYSAWQMSVKVVIFDKDTERIIDN
jgi:hypothetical protein